MHRQGQLVQNQEEQEEPKLLYAMILTGEPTEEQASA